MEKKIRDLKIHIYILYACVVIIVCVHSFAIMKIGESLALIR